MVSIRDTDLLCCIRTHTKCTSLGVGDSIEFHVKRDFVSQLTDCFHSALAVPLTKLPHCVEHWGFTCFHISQN